MDSFKNKTFMKNLLPKKMRRLGVLALFIFGSVSAVAQDKAVIEAILVNANHDSQLERLDHQLMYQLGPRFVGTPEIEASHNWVVDKYKSGGIQAEYQQWAEWRAWDRCISHIDMVSPRVQSS